MSLNGSWSRCYCCCYSYCGDSGPASWEGTAGSTWEGGPRREGRPMLHTGVLKQSHIERSGWEKAAHARSSSQSVFCWLRRRSLCSFTVSSLVEILKTFLLLFLQLFLCVPDVVVRVLCLGETDKEAKNEDLFFNSLALLNRSSRRNCDGNQHLTKKRENFRLKCNKSTQEKERDFQTRIELITHVHNKQRSLFVKNVAFILRRNWHTQLSLSM